jgi:hypothetical protein
VGGPGSVLILALPHVETEPQAVLLPLWACLRGRHPNMNSDLGPASERAQGRMWITEEHCEAGSTQGGWHREVKFSTHCQSHNFSVSPPPDRDA